MEVGIAHNWSFLPIPINRKNSFRNYVFCIYLYKNRIRFINVKSLIKTLPIKHANWRNHKLLGKFEYKYINVRIHLKFNWANLKLVIGIPISKLGCIFWSKLIKYINGLLNNIHIWSQTLVHFITTNRLRIYFFAIFLRTLRA